MGLLKRVRLDLTCTRAHLLLLLQLPCSATQNNDFFAEPTRPRDGSAGFSGDGGGSSGEFRRRRYTARWGPARNSKKTRSPFPCSCRPLRFPSLSSTATAMASPDFFSGDVQNLIYSLSTEKQNCGRRHYRGSLHRRRGSLLLRSVAHFEIDPLKSNPLDFFRSRQ
eukprot:TRINITY_DN5832_c0_g2_i1.p1 TRINITY_DN5832_c0_g2~~TRINITY_DN5832_c0_g2_i1.p1  ORF type:complete len:166 (-),score=16.05 TRINITY_DN5832_c0_g2_i1:127-624(-)